MLLIGLPVNSGTWPSLVQGTWLGARGSRVRISPSRQKEFGTRGRNVSVRRYATGMQRPISIPQPPWTDTQLAEAIRTSTNWRSVMLLLGFGERARSASAIRIVRRRATELDLDSSHFRGKRRWSDIQLRQAVAESQSWQEVLSRLGLSTGNGTTPHIKSHAVRLDLDTSHLNKLSHDGRLPSEPPAAVTDLKAQLKYLRVAAGTVAAAWFALRGCAVSFPVDPAEFDLLARTPGGISRVQVKTTTFHRKDGWIAGVGHHPDTHSKNGHPLAYDPVRLTCSSSSTGT